MRRLGFAVVLTAACLLVVALPATPATPSTQSTDYSYARIVRLSLVEGEVQISRPEEEGWQTALINMPLQQGYAVATGRGRAEIEFESGATARIAEYTVLQFTELALANGARITRLTLTQGTATFYANLAREDSFAVLTPHLQVTIPDNARFRLDTNNDGTTVSTFKGDITVDSRGGSYRLTKGRSLFFRAVDVEPVTLARNPEPDEWDRWVSDRDEVIHTATNATRGYVESYCSSVSGSCPYGLWDLYYYGNWIHLPQYGQCWRPGNMPIGWSPYWNGRWSYMHNIGWTWVSYEPWGWVPYHYGRWALANVGWVWIPGGFNTWHPGLVHWLQFGNFVGWAPLGPHDPPGSRPAGGMPPGTVVNTPPGVINGTPNQRPNISPEDRPRWVGGAPLEFDDTPRRGRGSLGPYAGAPKPFRPPEGPQPQGGIVYDPQERRYVNNPAAPRAAGVDTDDAPRPRYAPPSQAPGYSAAPTTPTAPPSSVMPPGRSRPPISRDMDVDNPAYRPSGVRGREAPAEMRPTPSSRPPSYEPAYRSTAPPGGQIRGPERSPNVNAPRPAPTHRPSYDAPRPAPTHQPSYDAPRPAPSPQPRYEGATSRPSPPPSPPPHAERPPTRPPKPEH